MEQRDFLQKEAILTPEKELELRALREMNTALHEENAVLHKEVTVLHEENAELKEELAYLKKIVYGQKSEKTETLAGAAQIPMFDEAETEAEPNAVREITVPEHKRKAKRTHDELMKTSDIYRDVALSQGKEAE